MFFFDTYKNYFIVCLLMIIAGIWIGLLYWTVRDIRLRTQSWIMRVFSGLLVLILFIPGFLIYLLFRPRRTIDEAFFSYLQEETLMRSLIEPAFCPECKNEISQNWVVCPICHTPLKKPCLKCGKHIDNNWTICPYCGNENLNAFNDLTIKKLT